MHPDLEQLVTLQAVELELRAHRAGLAAGPGLVKAAETTRAQAEAAAAATRKALETEEALRRRQESDAEDHRTKARRLRRQLEAATSAAQVTAYEHEIAFAETAVARLDDEQMASMERSEELESRLKGEDSAAARARESLDAVRAQVAEASAGHAAAVERLEAERKAVRAAVEATAEGEALLSTFDRVGKARGTALAEAREGQCTACRMKLRPQRWQDIGSREHENEIYTCESCGRLLYFDPRGNVPGAWPPGERLSAALATARS